VLCSTLLIAIPVCAGALRPAYLPSIQKRIEASEIVCSATILSTNSTSNTVEVGDELAAQWTALASVDQVFKGSVSSQIIHFNYYRLVPRSADYFGPPDSHFESGVRYAIFLKGRETDLHTAIPLYQMEVQLSPESPSQAQPHRSALSALARELLLAVQSAPATIGRSATHYFSWAEELFGNKTVPLVQPFLKEADPLVRYQAAWWLSFRNPNDTVVAILLTTASDQTIEAWARSGAEQRVRDMGVIDRHQP
jgi:hypothetical protein